MAATIELYHQQHGDVIQIHCASTCGPMGRQHAHVADIMEPESSNPAIRFISPSGLMTLGLTEKICAYVRERPWEK